MHGVKEGPRTYTQSGQFPHHAFCFQRARVFHYNPIDPVNIITIACGWEGQFNGFKMLQPFRIIPAHGLLPLDKITQALILGKADRCLQVTHAKIVSQLIMDKALSRFEA